MASKQSKGLVSYIVPQKYDNNVQQLLGVFAALAGFALGTLTGVILLVKTFLGEAHLLKTSAGRKRLLYGERPSGTKGTRAPEIPKSTSPEVSRKPPIVTDSREEVAIGLPVPPKALDALEEKLRSSDAGNSLSQRSAKQGGVTSGKKASRKTNGEHLSSTTQAAAVPVLNTPLAVPLNEAVELPIMTEDVALHNSLHKAKTTSVYEVQYEGDALSTDASTSAPSTPRSSTEVVAEPGKEKRSKKYLRKIKKVFKSNNKI